MKRVFASACLALALITGTAAQAQTVQQRDFLFHIARVAVLSRKCPQWQIDYGNVALLGFGYGVANTDLDPDGRFHEQFRSFIRKDLEFFSDRSREQACSFAAHDYGPDGVAVKDLMIQEY